MKLSAVLLGANAVVGISFKIVETYAARIGVGEIKTFKLIAFGTAVKLSLIG